MCVLVRADDRAVTTMDGQTATGAVPREALLAIAHELALDTKWTRDQVERFCELFARWESDGSDPDDTAVNYRLLVSFLFFPLEREPSRLKLKECVALDGPLAVYPGELVLGPVPTESSGVPVTVKKLSFNAASPPNANDDDAVEKLRHQVNYLRLFSHPNITRYYSTLELPNALYIVEESRPSCSLKTILDSFGPMKEPTIRRYVQQMLQGLEYLHDRGIAHGYECRVSSVVIE